MKKKIKDLTLEQRLNICRVNYYCSECPLSRKGGNCINSEGYVPSIDYLEKEVEVYEK